MPAIESAPSMPSVLEVDVPTPPSSAGAAQVSQSWLPKAGSTLQPDPTMGRGAILGNLLKLGTDLLGGALASLGGAVAS